MEPKRKKIQLQLYVKINYKFQKSTSEMLMSESIGTAKESSRTCKLHPTQ
jgi:hypothetical protein